TLASSPVSGNLIQGNGANESTGSTSSNVTKYVASSGATVFATGTNYWSRGLSLDGDGNGEPNHTIQQITTNAMVDMGASPGTPAADIVVSGAAPQRPSAPTGLAPTQQAPNQTGLTGSPGPGADGDDVDRSPTPRTGGEPLG